MELPDHDKDKYKDKDKDKDKDSNKDKNILRTPPKSNLRDLWPLSSEFVRVMRRHGMTKKMTKTNTKTKTQTQTKTFWEHLLRAILETCDLETFVQSDQKTWHDQKIDKDKYKDKDKDILRTRPKSHPRDLWPLRHLFRVMIKHEEEEDIFAK